MLTKQKPSSPDSFECILQSESSPRAQTESEKKPSVSLAGCVPAEILDIIFSPLKAQGELTSSEDLE